MNGYQLSFPTSSPTVAGGVINVAAGACRDSTNTNDIVSLSSVTLDISVRGLGGFDRAAVVSNTLYAIYIIGDSTKFSSTSTIASPSHNEPILPVGYDVFRRVGVARTGAIVQFLPFVQWGNSRDRHYSLIDKLPVVTAGLGTIQQTLSLAEEVPHIPTLVNLSIVMTPVLSGSRIRLNVYNELVNQNYNLGSGILAVQRAMIKVPVSAIDGDPRLVWALQDIGDRVDIAVQGFDDHL